MIDIKLVKNRRNIPKYYALPSKQISTHIVGLITEGALMYEVEKQTLALQARDLFFFPNQTLRRGYACPPYHLNMYSAHFLITAPQFMLPFIENNQYFKIAVNNFDYIKHRFVMLFTKNKEKMPYYELHCQAILLDLLIAVQHELELQKHSIKKLQIVQELKKMIEENYAQPITVTELAKFVNRTPNYTSQLFKEIIGQSPVEYINQMRITAAQELLTNSELSVSEIAEQVGFSDHYYFNKVYKRLTGLTPKCSVMD